MLDSTGLVIRRHYFLIVIKRAPSSPVPFSQHMHKHHHYRHDHQHQHRHQHHGQQRYFSSSSSSPSSSFSFLPFIHSLFYPLSIPATTTTSPVLINFPIFAHLPPLLKINSLSMIFPPKRSIRIHNEFFSPRRRFRILFPPYHLRWIDKLFFECSKQANDHGFILNFCLLRFLLVNIKYDEYFFSLMNL